MVEKEEEKKKGIGVGKVEMRKKVICLEERSA
jgi:hypothetical protein